MLKKISILLICIAMSFYAGAQQTSFDETDSIVNQQRQYIIRFDVANGNIYVPVKKKISSSIDKKSYFKKIPFAYMKDSIGKVLHHVIKYTDSTKKPDSVWVHKVIRQGEEKKYLTAGKFYKPKVGSFMRLVFENVPKNMDVGVNVEFLDKNLENASTAQGYLNKFGSALDTAVSEETRRLIVKIKNDTVQIVKKDSANKQQLIDKMEDFNKSANEVVNNIQNLSSKLTDNKPFNDRSKILEGVDNNLQAIKDVIAKIHIRDSINPGIDSAVLNNVSQQVNKLIDKISESANNNAITVKGLKADKDSLRSLALKLSGNVTVIKELQNKMIAFHFERDSLRKIYDSTILAIYDSIYSRRTIYIQPIQISNNDLTLLRIVYHKDNKPENDISREIMLKNRYGFKLDFSTGFIGTGLKDDNYRVIPSPNTVRDTAQLQKDSKGAFAIGFALLAHAYVRTGERVNVAINTGLMLNGSNQTLNYLTGGSLALGLEQRFIISGGVAYGKVKRLTDGFAIDKQYPSNVLNLSSGVPYTERWQKSWYIGVSYNISSLTAASHRVVVAR